MDNIDLVEGTIKDLERITKNLSEVLVLAFDHSRNRGGKELDPRDIFLGVLTHKKNIAARLLERLGVDLKATTDSILKDYNSGMTNSSPQFGDIAKELLSRCFLISSELNHVYVGTEHMLLAIMEERDMNFVKDLEKNGLNSSFIKQALSSFGVYQPGIFTKAAKSPEMEAGQQSSLQFFAKDMNYQAKEGKYLKVWGRQDEVERMIHILSRRTKNNPLLVGEAGVGKTAIVEGFVQRILSGQVPDSFKNKKVVQLDLSAIIAGSKIRGDIEERLLSIISEVTQDPNLILFIDEMHMIVGAGAAGSGSSMDVANILKPHLTSGDIRVIGATTFDEYQKYIEDDEALARRFQSIFVDEISPDDAINVLKTLKPTFENFHKVKITDEALIQSVLLSDRYITTKYLPDKAIDVIDEATAAKKIKLEKVNNDVGKYEKQLDVVKKNKNVALDEGSIADAINLRKKEVKLSKQIKKASKKNTFSRSKKNTVDVEDIRKVVSQWSKVPVTSMAQDELKILNKLETNLAQRIIGQDKALLRVSSALKRARMGLSDENRPLASFLFLGPTGVGKTETAKEIARTLFGGEDALIQVDMSEFMEQHSVSKLIGSPPGYVGYQEGGQLTEKVRRKPYSVILFDEIEKAHPDLVHILLQVLEEGQLQDGKGRKINFKNTIIVMTSNIGARKIGKDEILGFGVDTDNKAQVEEAYTKMKDKLVEELKDTLPPEFLNRIDDVIIFRGLIEEDARKITRLLIRELNSRLDMKGLQVALTTSAINFISKEGFDKEYGVRHIKRKILELIENPLATYVIDNKIDPNEKRDKITIKVEKEKKGLKLI